MNKGNGYAVGAYAIWGLFPIYWKWLRHVPSAQLVCHRIMWSFACLCLVVLALRQGNTLGKEISKPRVLGIYLAAAGLVAVNWLVYVWSVNAGLIVEASLGYFINPLLSVLMGVVLLRERLRPAQWFPIGLAGIGVVYLTLAHGVLPWVALVLAFSFGLYGLVKKTAPLGSLHGLTLETGILLVPSAGYLILSEARGTGQFLHAGTVSDLLLIGAGLVTTVPLLMFASATRRIPLSRIGILQYITPTVQFLLAILVYGEPFTATQFVGFGMVWAALAILAAESIWVDRTRPVPVVTD